MRKKHCYPSFLLFVHLCAIPLFLGCGSGVFELPEAKGKFDPLEKSFFEAGNARRRALGLREIKPPAKFAWFQFGEEKWYSGCDDLGYAKGVVYRCGDRGEATTNLLYEFDEYRTGVLYRTDEGDGHESLSVIYDYELKRYYFCYFGQNPKYYGKFDDLKHDDSPPPWGRTFNEAHGTDDVESFTNRVDPVFKDLGLNRLEYLPAPTSAIIHCDMWLPMK